MMKDSEDILVVDHLSAESRAGPCLRDFSIRIRRGEIHAILGDLDSGKDSFAELVSGGVELFSGILEFDGRTLRSLSRAAAIELGIATIYKTPQIIPSLSVFDNIYPKKRIRKGFVSENAESMKETAMRKLSHFSVQIDLNAAIESCTDNERLVVSIARCLCIPCKLLLIEEIGQRLSPPQVDALRAELSVLRERGATTLYFANNVNEVYNLADRLSFFHKGRLTTTQDIARFDKFDLVRFSYSHLYDREELESTNYELFFLKSYFENVIRSMPAPLVMTNNDGRITFVNRLFCVNFMVEEDGLIDRNIGELLTQGPEGDFDVRGWPEGKKRDMTKYTKVQVRLGQEAFQTDILIAPVIDSGESIMGHLLIFSDSSNTRLQMDNYRKILHENRRLPFFAHEIRNPLSIIRNFLNLLRTSPMSDDNRDYLLWIENEVKRIDHLVGDLIAESTVDRKGAERKRVEIRPLVEDIWKTVISPIRDKTIDFENEVVAGHNLAFDENGLKEILINLVINAVEAIPGRGRICVASEAETLDGKSYIVIQVADDGTGIEESIQGEIFNPFVSTKKGKEKRGLGLSICKDLIEGWGGFISLRSEPGRGSTFSVHLPA